MYEGKVIDRRGSVEAKNTVSDYTEIEQVYLRSIYASVLYTEYLDHKLNIIDAPGGDDFVGGVIPALRVANTSIMVINAQNGVEVGTEIQGRYLEKYAKPMMFFVNQLDSDKANWEGTIDSIHQSFGKKAIIVQYPLNSGSAFDGIIDVLLMKLFQFNGDTGVRTEHEIPANETERATQLHNSLVEAAAENDEPLMEIFFEKGSLTEDEMRRGLRRGIANRDLFPIFCGSAKKDMGIKRLMEFIINVTPYPNQVPKPKDTEGNEIACDSNAPTSIFVFKTVYEPHIGEVNYFKVISGKVTEGMDLTNMNNEVKERFSQLFASAGKNRNKITELYSGDIGCTVKLKNTKSNHTLNGSGAEWHFAPIEFPEPKFRTAIKARNEADDEKLGEMLTRTHQQDPTVLIEYSKELKQTIISGQGEHHLNILKWYPHQCL